MNLGGHDPTHNTSWSPAMFPSTCLSFQQPKPGGSKSFPTVGLCCLCLGSSLLSFLVASSPDFPALPAEGGSRLGSDLVPELLPLPPEQAPITILHAPSPTHTHCKIPPLASLAPSPPFFLPSLFSAALSYLQCALSKPPPPVLFPHLGGAPHYTAQLSLSPARMQPWGQPGQGFPTLCHCTGSPSFLLCTDPIYDMPESIVAPCPLMAHGFLKGRNYLSHFCAPQCLTYSQ